MSEKFKKRYDDPTLEFFYELLPDAQTHFKKVLKYLEKCLIEKNKESWFIGIKAMQSVANDMCFDGFNEINEPNKKNFAKIEEKINEIINLQR